jgi:hypothetical protein
MSSSENYNLWKDKAIKSAIKFANGEIEISLHIFVSYDEKDKRYNAHALEFDIVGEGKTPKKAIKELLELVNNHISFCIAYDNKDKIVFPAPEEYWTKFYKAGQDGSIRTPKVPKYDDKDLNIPYTSSRIGQFSVAYCQ